MQFLVSYHIILIYSSVFLYLLLFHSPFIYLSYSDPSYGGIPEPRELIAISKVLISVPASDFHIIKIPISNYYILDNNLTLLYIVL